MMKIKHIEIIDIQIKKYLKMNVEEQMYKMCTKCFDTHPFKMFHNYLKNYSQKN